MKPIHLRTAPTTESAFPLVCAPLVGRSRAALLLEAAELAGQGPDLLEWRVDFFEGIADSAACVALAADIRRSAGGLPLLFTRRSLREGGQPLAIDEAAVLRLYEAICREAPVDLVDVEMSSEPAFTAAVRAVSLSRGIGLVLSFHDFHATPPLDALLARFRQAEQLGGDVAKVAVMPRDAGDVLTLLSATWEASRMLAIPVISMAMGEQGVVSRIAGAGFGSALTFGAGRQVSAPGQLPIGQLRAALATLRPPRA